MPINSFDANQYLLRWRSINEQEIIALRSTSIATKFKQLSVLMESVNLFHDALQRDADVTEVRERWKKIHDAYNA